MICVLQKCIIDSAKDKPVSPLCLKLEAYSSRILLHFNLQFRLCSIMVFFPYIKQSLTRHYYRLSKVVIQVCGSDFVWSVYILLVLGLECTKSIWLYQKHLKQVLLDTTAPIWVSWVQTLFKLDQVSLVEKQSLLALSPTPRSYKENGSWFRLFMLVLMLLRDLWYNVPFRCSQTRLTSTTTHSIWGTFA